MTKKTLLTIITAIFCYLLPGLATAQVNDKKFYAPAPLVPWVKHQPSVTTVTVNIKKEGAENLSWTLSTPERAVFFGRLKRLKDIPHPNDKLFPHAHTPDSGYKGLKITFGIYGDIKLPPLHIYQGAIQNAEEQYLFRDRGRLMEYWILGTTDTPEVKQATLNMVPVFSFKQCKLMGYPIIETRPAQCLMPNDQIMLKTPEEPTLETLKMKNFDDCLKHGKAIIDTFPRHCLAPGGKIFAEPPRVPETLDEYIRDIRRRKES